MATCSECGSEAWRFALTNGLCSECAAKAIWKEASERLPLPPPPNPESAAGDEALLKVIVTTETAHNLPVSDRLDIVTAEVVIGMHLFKDIAAAFRDTFGGRSKVMQDGLRDARKTAMAELRREAHGLGADAVVGVQLAYSEISGGGKSMILLVASGTAVTLERRRGLDS